MVITLMNLTAKNAKHILLLQDLAKSRCRQLQARLWRNNIIELDKKRKQMLIDFQYNMGSDRSSF